MGAIAAAVALQTYHQGPKVAMACYDECRFSRSITASTRKLQMRPGSFIKVIDAQLINCQGRWRCRGRTQ
jgi:hypothetical protein